MKIQSGLYHNFNFPRDVKGPKGQFNHPPNSGIKECRYD